MGYWTRVQANGAMARIGKRITGDPRLWKPAPDGRPRFVHWLEKEASDADLQRAKHELDSFLQEIPERWLGHAWAEEIVDRVNESVQAVLLEVQRRGTSTGWLSNVALPYSEDAGEEEDDAEASLNAERAPRPEHEQSIDNVRRPIIELFEAAMRRQEAKFAGRVETEAQRRTLRQNALVEVSLRMYEAIVPGMDLALREGENREGLATRFREEYIPLLMIDPEDLPRVFADYLLWSLGGEQASVDLVDIDELKETFREAISLLPAGTRDATIKGKHRFEWGKLV